MVADITPSGELSFFEAFSNFEESGGAHHQCKFLLQFEIFMCRGLKAAGMEGVYESRELEK